MRKCAIQIAFNNAFVDFEEIVRYLPQSDHIIIEAGTPLIKREGIDVIGRMRSLWHGNICADMKIIDGAYHEVAMAKQMGATSVTAMGNTTKESLGIFVETCRKMDIISIVDMMNNQNPLKTLWRTNIVPDMVFIHRGRDEENSYGKIIQYKDIAKIKGKWNIKVGAAGGIDRKELQSAIFNNADVVVVNIVQSTDKWKGIVFDDNFQESLQDFLKFIE